jgi:hypothetical protein
MPSHQILSSSGMGRGLLKRAPGRACSANFVSTGFSEVRRSLGTLAHILFTQARVHCVRHAAS